MQLFRTALFSCSLALASSALVHGQENSKPTKDATLHKMEGVITKVSKLDEEKGDKEPRYLRITINTAAMWRDYVRDQEGSSSKNAGKTGENSIATKGEPESPETTFLIEVGPKSHLVTRFRASSDETNQGSRTVEGAEKKEGNSASQDVERTPHDNRAPKTTLTDLKVGQFVEIESKEGKASRVCILKPIRDPVATPKVEKP